MQPNNILFISHFIIKQSKTGIMEPQLKQIREQQKETWNKFSPGYYGAVMASGEKY
jgi:hypothetical protein